MSLLITVEKLYFVDGVYSVTANVEQTLSPDVMDYIKTLDIAVIQPPRKKLNRALLGLLLDSACMNLARHYSLATARELHYNTDNLAFAIDWNPKTYPDYREAIEGVEGVYLTD